MPIVTTLFALAVACTTIDANPKVITTDSLDRLFAEGTPFSEFLANAKSNADDWKGNYNRAEVPDALVSRVRMAGSSWRLLVVAAHGCSDSRSTIPYIARLAELSGVDLRIIDADKGSGIMKAHRTPDGRAATPTIVLLSADGTEAGCWIERPAALIKHLEDGKKGDEKFESKMSWYKRDKGQETLREITEMIEAARAGTPKCG